MSTQTPTPNDLAPLLGAIPPLLAQLVGEAVKRVFESERRAEILTDLAKAFVLVRNGVSKASSTPAPTIIGHVVRKAPAKPVAAKGAKAKDPHGTCSACGVKGHRSSYCPQGPKPGVKRARAKAKPNGTRAPSAAAAAAEGP